MLHKTVRNGLLLALAAALGLAGNARAQSPDFYSFSWLGHADPGDPGFTTFVYDFNSGAIPVSSSVAGSHVYSDPLGDVTVSGYARGTSSYIHQGVEVSATVANAQFSLGGDLHRYYDAAAVAGFRTSVRIFGPSLVQGDIYTQRYTYRITGDASQTGGDAHSFLYFQIGNDAAEGSYFYGNDTFVTNNHTFQPGVATPLQVEFNADWTVDMTTVAAGSTVSGTADFFHTLTLENVEVFDALNIPVFDFEIVDAGSGERIFRGGASSAAPEPSSLALLSLCATAGIVARRRQSSRRQASRRQASRR